MLTRTSRGGVATTRIRDLRGTNVSGAWEDMRCRAMTNSPQNKALLHQAKNWRERGEKGRVINGSSRRGGEDLVERRGRCGAWRGGGENFRCQAERKYRHRHLGCGGGAKRVLLKRERMTGMVQGTRWRLTVEEGGGELRETDNQLARPTRPNTDMNGSCNKFKKKSRSGFNVD